MLRGPFKFLSTSYTTGSPLYLSTTAGGIVDATTSFTSGDYVRIIGHALANNVIYFNPDNTWVEIA